MDETAVLGVPPVVAKEAVAMIEQKGGLTAEDIHSLCNRAGQDPPPLHAIRERLEGAIQLGLATGTGEGRERRFRAFEGPRASEP